MNQDYLADIPSAPRPEGEGRAGQRDAAPRAASARRRHLLGGLCVLFILGSGCEMFGLSDPEQPAPPANTTKRTPPATPPPVTIPEASAAEEETPYERPEYPDNSGRNPFRIDVETVIPSVVVTVTEERPVEPLEQFGLSQLALVGVISETAVPKAMFIDPEGFGHVVKEGDRIGRQGGIITDIRDNEVDIQESAGEGNQAPANIRTLRLSDTEIRSVSGDDELSDAERQALERLLKSEEGRQKLRDNLREQIERESQQNQIQGNAISGVAPPVQ